MSAEHATLMIAASESDSNLFYATRFMAPDPFIFLEIKGERILIMSDLEMDRARSQAQDDAAVLRALHQAPPSFNPYLDLNSYADRMLSAKRLGIVTIGGGVPRNWAQQVAPYVEISNVRLGLDVKPPRFQYGVRICPEPDYWGGLSGCTYQEGISWGKFMPPEEGGRFAEVLSDATVVWPLLMVGLLERLRSKPAKS